MKYNAGEDFFTATIYRSQKDLFADNETKETSPKLHQNFTINSETSPELHQNFTINLPAGATKTLEELKKNSFATAEEIAKVLNISSRSVKTHFSILKEKGLIEYTGSKKGGHWIIKAFE